jgi:EAL and modified HD-GYP domain-containing signal transduction protein
VDLRATADGTQAPDQVFIARQPILDCARRVFAYELLFRPTADALISDTNGAEATARVMTDAVLAFGLDTLTGGRPAFLNMTRDLLLEGVPNALPASRVVLELLEDIEADADVIEAVKRLRHEGYAIALDDFVLTDRTAALVPLADYIKVDITEDVDVAPLKALLSRDRNTPALLAEKVETHTEYELATAQGFRFFQGYFFGRPLTQVTKSVPANRVSLLRLMCALQDPDLSVQSLDALVKHDPVLCYRILRTVNSAGFGQARQIESIRQALIMLGIDAVRRWASIWVLAGMGEGSHSELVVMSTVRARCCELLAATRGRIRATDGFLLGMCSLLDAILGQPIEIVIADLPLPEQLRAALRGEDSDARRLLDCAVACERGNWNECHRLALLADIDPRVLPSVHGEALRWAAAFKPTE